jgi:hypothetical protein
MGGAVNPVRAVSAALSLGTSELAQKKPFQDIDKDRPIGGASASPLRFVPAGGATLGAVTDVAKLGGPPPPPDDEANALDAEAAKADAEKVSAAQRAADDLAARTETPQEALDARKRASGVAERLGIRGRRRTASDTLLGGPQGPL